MVKGLLFRFSFLKEEFVKGTIRERHGVKLVSRRDVDWRTLTRRGSETRRLNTEEFDLKCVRHLAIENTFFDVV